MHGKLTAIVLGLFGDCDCRSIQRLRLNRSRQFAENLGGTSAEVVIVDEHLAPGHRRSLIQQEPINTVPAFQPVSDFEAVFTRKGCTG